MHSQPKILIVDDEPRMCDSIKLLLSRHNFDIRTAYSGQEALECFSNDRFDVVLLDIEMPGMTGIELMDHLNTTDNDAYIIIITGNASLETAVDALRKGAYDFLRKPFEYDELVKTVQNAVAQKRLKHECETINGKLETTERHYRYLIENSPDIIYMLDENGKFTFISNAVERLLGYKCEQLMGEHYSSIIYDKDLDIAQYYFTERRTGSRATSGIELRLKAYKNGHPPGHIEKMPLTVELQSTGMYKDQKSGKVKKYIGTHGVARDVSNKKRLELQLENAQRMEALGTLGGGIAHDFNNLLMGIQGNTSLMLLGMAPDHSNYEKLKSIEHQVQSGAELTRQLLGMARGGKYKVQPVDLNSLIVRNTNMFGRTKKEIKLFKKLQEKIWTVEVDEGQIEQVLLNLYVNAWQAMPKGGILSIETENVILGKEDVSPYQLDPGKYIRISVSDNGVGMDKEVQDRIFEPFFTTKEMGRGTGLGLASAYGIVKNHKGIIKVESEKSEGSTFTLFLPASELEAKEKKESVQGILKGSGAILFVDDEDVIIDVGREMLESLGYNILAARSGQEALNVFKANMEKIDLVILDMIMPEMTGGETFDRLKDISPDVKVLLSSGYSMNEMVSEIMEKGCVGFLQKPFDIETLSQEINKILQS